MSHLAAQTEAWQFSLSPAGSMPTLREPAAGLSTHPLLAALRPEQVAELLRLAAAPAALEQARGREAADSFILALVVVTSACTLGIAALHELSPSYHPSQSLISSGSIIVGGLFMYWLLRRSGYALASLGLTLRGFWPLTLQAVLYTLPVLGLLLVTKWAFIHGDPALRGQPLFNPGALFAAQPFALRHYALALLGYAALSPVQEFFYRGGLQGLLAKLLPAAPGRINWRAIVLANLVFASVHGYIGFRFAVVAFVPGLLWGWLVERQRSLVGAAVSHILIGSVALFGLGLQVIIGGN